MEHIQARRITARAIALLLAVVVTCGLALAPITQAQAQQESASAASSSSSALSASSTDAPSASESPASAQAPSPVKASSSSSSSSATSSNSSSAKETGSSATSATSTSSKAAAQAAQEPVTIKYDSNTGIHYVDDADSVLGRIILYCMNNEAEWPHSIPSNPNVPSFTLGYLTPDMFSSQDAYEECMEKLLAILYAGYPYNGLHMYEVGSVHNITEAEFNEKLDAPSAIRSDFPDSVGNTTFTYSDYTNNNTENLTKLNNFMLEVGELYPNGKSASGLTYQQIVATDFYQAAFDMYMGQQGSTPLQWWDNTHGSDYYVDDSAAYWGTQYAIWVVLNQYGIGENNLTLESAQVQNYPLAKKLVEHADAGAVLRTEPTDSHVSIDGDAQFAYDPASKTWRTGALSISEATGYNGHYSLTLPDGITAVDEDGNAVSTSDVRAGRAFYLQSATKPTEAVGISAKATLTWLKETRQYSPVKNEDGSEITITVNGQTKHYQHMIGAVIKQKTVSASLEAKPASEGNLTVSKKVNGEANSTSSFTFTVTLNNKKINGTYGDMNFTDGVATVTLQDGKSATAEHLPGGTGYTVAESANDDYKADQAKRTGTIPSDGTAATASFTNTRLYQLTVSKTVSGQAASSTQPFKIKVTLADAAGNPLSGSFSYKGGTVSDVESATAPADGSLTLDGSGSGTVTLSHGQQIVISGIPSGTAYTVEEESSTETDALLYDATYNGSATAATGTLSSNSTVAVANAVQEGSLSVTKRVTGEANPTQSFTFTVKLGGSGASLSGTYGDMDFTDGQATFTLTNGKTKTAQGLPAGATYTVTEESNSNYAISYENAKGTIDKGKTAQVTVTNTRGAISLPLSGQAGLLGLYLLGAALLAAAAYWLHARRNTSHLKGGETDER